MHAAPVIYHEGDGRGSDSRGPIMLLIRWAANVGVKPVSSKQRLGGL